MNAIGIVGASAALSRILGFIRDVMIARYFGAGFYSDAFFAAFRIPDFLRRLLMEGSLSMAFVSVFTEYLVKDGKKQAINFAGSALKFKF
jgi:putative peptidoglycan lipid II flippase